jgi:ubiquinone/menaquinone biosynthesis C-methylase UbiE
MPEAIARKQYDHMAGTYDWLWQSYIARTLALLKRAAQIAPYEIVLDVACGTGAFERMLLAEFATQRLVGVDISPRMLQIAERKCCRFPALLFLRARASALPCQSQSFEVIVSANAFHYFDQPLTVLEQMRRALKVNGRLIILDWCKDFPLCALCDVVLSAIDPAHQHCYTQREFHQLLSAAGFEIHHATRARFGLIWGVMLATAAPRQADELTNTLRQSLTQ